MKLIALLCFSLALLTNSVIANAGNKYPILSVTSQSPRNLTPWLGPGSIDARVIFIEETNSSNYSFFVCSDLSGQDCIQINEGPVSANGLANLVANGIGLNHWDLPIMADLEWGFALPSTRDFVNNAGSRLLSVIQSRGQAEMISIRTGGSTNGEILAKQIVFYSGAKLKE